MPQTTSEVENTIKRCLKLRRQRTPVMKAASTLWSLPATLAGAKRAIMRPRNSPKAGKNSRAATKPNAPRKITPAARPPQMMWPGRVFEISPTLWATIRRPRMNRSDRPSKMRSMKMVARVVVLRTPSFLEST
ncbi:hypothetical protein D3C72_1278940 [compost metagenome]